MQLQDAFGYEQEDGSILYTITKSPSFDKISIDILFRKIPTFENLDKKALCVNDYFIKGNEDTKWRILYKLDGNTMYKFIDIETIFTFNPTFE